MGSDSKTLNDVVGQLDKILFDDYIKGRSVALAATIEKGVLGNGIDWHRAPKPTGELLSTLRARVAPRSIDAEMRRSFVLAAVHPYIYDALLSLVLVHAQVTAIARSLVTRTIGALVQEVAKHALACFSQVASFGMGGMLQATLEMEFLHQTLNTHVSSGADATLQEIYKIISAKYRPGGPPGEGAGELQAELEQLKLTLTQARRATALQFLCFRERKAAVGQAAGSGSAPAASSGVGQGGGAPSRR
jgi:exocyst complex component 2